MAKQINPTGVHFFLITSAIIIIFGGLLQATFVTFVNIIFYLTNQNKSLDILLNITNWTIAGAFLFIYKSWGFSGDGNYFIYFFSIFGILSFIHLFFVILNKTHQTAKWVKHFSFCLNLFVLMILIPICFRYIQIIKPFLEYATK